MKVAILGTRGIPNRYGGFERFAEELSQELSKRGYMVYVTSPATHSCEELNANNIFTVNLRVPRFLTSNLATLYYDYISLKWAIRNNIDVVIECGHSFAPLLLFVSASVRSKIITNPDGIEHRRKKWGWIAKSYLRLSEYLAFKLSAQLVCDNRALVQYYSNRYKRILHYIPYGAHPLMQAPGRPDVLDKLHIKEYYLLITRITPENNVDAVLSYFAQSGQACLVVGDFTSSYAKKIDRKYRSFRNIHFLGVIYDQQILNGLRFYCKAYIHGHSAGGTNPSLLEAMACGCFIIAHNNPFNRDILGEQGLYFSNASTLGNCISKFEKLNDVEINRVKEQNIQAIERNFLWEKVALAYIEVIERLKK